MADESIKNAFLDGIEEVFKIMFTDEVYLHLLDGELTKVNIYNETTNKVYKSPLKLVGKVTTAFEKGEDPIEEVNIDAVITVPAKQLITLGIPHASPQDLEMLETAKISYKWFEYLVERVVPKTLVADTWQLYEFRCYVDKKDS